jgi:hypothetical protein
MDRGRKTALSHTPEGEKRAALKTEVPISTASIIRPSLPFFGPFRQQFAALHAFICGKKNINHEGAQRHAYPPPYRVRKSHRLRGLH